MQAQLFDRRLEKSKDALLFASAPGCEAMSYLFFHLRAGMRLLSGAVRSNACILHGTLQ
jgi:hypothetical protein